MASYVVMEPPARTMGGKAGRNGRGERAVLVRDGFRFLAFLLPPVWLACHRLWIEALLVVAVSMALSGLGMMAGFGNAAPVLLLLVSLYAGLEGSTLLLARYRRRGWHEWGVVEADNAADAEIRYLAEALTAEDETPAPAPVPAAAATPRGVAQPALGLLAYPGKS
jgi:hypothetical protein